MILIHNFRKIKLIPYKYASITNITDYLEDFDHIRLNTDEREYLDHALFSQAAYQLLQKIAENEKLVYEHIGDARPLYIVKAETSDGQTFSP